MEKKKKDEQEALLVRSTIVYCVDFLFLLLRNKRGKRRRILRVALASNSTTSLFIPQLSTHTIGPHTRERGVSHLQQVNNKG